MASIVGVQFQKNGKVFYFDDNQLELQPGQYIIADTAHGMDLGQVVSGPFPQEDAETDESLRKILRAATEADLQISSNNRIREREAFGICQKKIAEHQLDMKLVSVEYAFDGSKALFYFTANGRVDFRSLVKDLASVFKMRIELRQIGVRDEARMIGGLGPCGRQICCGSFLDEFQPVSIKMAKEQNLSLNPTKISGVCGRLMCCLKYEQDFYEQTRKMMPRIGKEVSTPDGTGTVSDLNIVKETVFVRITNGDSSEIKEYPLEKIKAGNAAAVPPCERRKAESAYESPQDSGPEEGLQDEGSPAAETDDGIYPGEDGDDVPPEMTDPENLRPDENDESAAGRAEENREKDSQPQKNRTGRQPSDGSRRPGGMNRRPADGSRRTERNPRKPADGNSRPADQNRRPEESRKKPADSAPAKGGRNNRGTGGGDAAGKSKDPKKPGQNAVRNSPNLGKPVMRENPNRNSAPQGAPDPAGRSSGSGKGKPAYNWAEAVQRAMDNIE